jgi:hypothetical protein
MARDGEHRANGRFVVERRRCEASEDWLLRLYND